MKHCTNGPKSLYKPHHLPILENFLEHFEIVHAICRLALAQPTDALAFQVKRLADTLSEEGNEEDSSSLREVLLLSERSSEMTPRRLVPARGVSVPGETLSPNTILPADKETGARLLDVIFPNEMAKALPIFSDAHLRAAEQLIAEWSNAEKLRAIGVSPTMSCLIVGAPGTGKTTLAYWLAHQLGLPVVLARIDAMMSSFLGTSARNITQVFNFANRFKCVLVLDEFDSIAKMRDDPNEAGEIKRVVNALLQNLDSRKPIGITIAVTNHPRLLDSAVWRRFEVQVQVPLPDFATRCEIVRRYSSPCEYSEAEIVTIAALLIDCSGAEVEDFVRAYKKRYILDPLPTSPVDAMRDVIVINDGRVSSEVKAKFLADDAQLVVWLKSNSDLRLGVVEIASLIGKSKSAVSRLMNTKF